MTRLASGIARSSIVRLKMNKCQLQAHQMTILIQQGVVPNANIREVYESDEQFWLERNMIMFSRVARLET
jgi:hypothetical protein